MSAHNVVLVLVIGLQFLGMLVCVATIGKPREPLSPRGAVITVVISLLVIWSMWFVSGGWS